jgi:serine/threonine-protein kinase HipA
MIVTTARVLLFGTHVASVAWDDERELGIFEYDPDFLPSGIEIAPLTMLLGAGTFSFPNLSRETFKGLPGLLADSLPDKFGNRLIDRWLAGQARTPQSFNPVERLCYLGARGMGALEFEPTLSRQGAGSAIDVAKLVELANQALADRGDLHTHLHNDEALTEILRVGTSAGGARAKAIVAWNPATNEVRSGQVNLQGGFEPWLIKFDGVSENRDKESSDPQGYGRIEYAYHLMARAAGIAMSDCRLFEESGRAHFMTRRFDRTPQGDKLHQQTLCGMNHMDFNQAGEYSYEQAFQVARILGLPNTDEAEMYRRAVFNILARNQDDHTKNLSFLMDRSGTWRLAPAYDVIYSYNPSGAWTSRHQMSLAGKRDDFTRDDLLEAASAANVKAPKARNILDEVSESVNRWKSFAEQAQVDVRQAELIGIAHRHL